MDANFYPWNLDLPPPHVGLCFAVRSNTPSSLQVSHRTSSAVGFQAMWVIVAACSVTGIMITGSSYGSSQRFAAQLHSGSGYTQPAEISWQRVMAIQSTILTVHK